MLAAVDEVTLRPIGVVRSAFSQRFGIPRQAGLCEALRCSVELFPDRVSPEALRGLEESSHVWVLTWMHQSVRGGVRAKAAATVRPPRLGGSRRLGALATRAPFRPNPIGLSACRLASVRGLELELVGGDFLDGSPVLDLKPYVPYADCLPEATSSWAAQAPRRIAVRWSAAIEDQLETLHDAPWLRDAAKQILGLDPRPARRPTTEGEAPPAGEAGSVRPHVVRLGPFDLHFRIDAEGAQLLEIVRVAAQSVPASR